MKLVNQRRKAIAVFLLLIFLFQICLPLRSFALTGGPSQPEVQSFEPVGTTDMVDLFTGDFNYNIPLLDVEGYPVNISYHSGISMDQEASWVGLGWNINPGVINRSMRGLPDDFNGDQIHQEYDTKPHKTMGLNAGLAFELFGLELKSKLNLKVLRKITSALDFSIGVKYDNYRGMGYSFGITSTANVSKETKENETRISTTKINNFSLGLNFNSQEGTSLSPNYSRSIKNSVTAENGTTSDTKTKSVGFSFNSRKGFTGFTLGISKKNEQQRDAISRTVTTSNSDNGGTFLTQNHPSYQPSAKQKLNTFSLNINFKGGIELFGANPDLNASGFFSQQHYEKDRIAKGYGCLYDYNKPENYFVQDFNRFNEGSYNIYTKNLPLSTTTPDYFSVSGQGIGGCYKVKQSYVPLVYDDEVSSNSTEIGVGAEIGAGNTIKFGINVSPVFTSSRSGVKKLRKEEKKYIGYHSGNLPVDYEKSYFKFVGEKTPVNKNYYELLNKNFTNEPQTFLDNIAAKADQIKSPYESQAAIQKEREKRNQEFQYLTVEEINKIPSLALDASVKSYPLNSLAFLWDDNPTHVPQPSIITRSALQEDKHISEVTVLSDDGRRYVYGIPAMNTKQEEYTFSLPQNPSVTNQIATYSVSGGNIVYNFDKVNYIYHKQEMPRYAYAYLLTGLLSADYIDKGNQGISDDDYGSAVKFNYTRTSNLFHWRTPYAHLSANYQEGNKSNPNDNKCSFSYGEKDIWYMHSIETKNFVAVFMMSKREDGLGVINRDGAINTADTLMKLDSIILYSKSDLISNKYSAVPIKTVHFVYDYSLCKNVDNNSTNAVGSPNINANKGKLTLKKIYFTYGLSNKGMYTSYRFGYVDPDVNYNIKAYDRWGNYSPFSAGTSTDPSNAEWPYTTQIKVDADGYASAWNLNKIELPTGGVMNVTYESDDYAYVQNKQAQMMVKIEDIGNSNTDFSTGKSKSFLYHGETNNNYLFFKIPVTATTIPIKNYFTNIDQLFFNIRTIINKKDNYQPEEDIIGFCEIEKDGNNDPLCGIVSGHSDYGWVKVKEVSIKDNDNANGTTIQPMAKQAFIFAVQDVPETVYPSSNPNATGVKAIRGLFPKMGEMFDIFKHFYAVMRNHNICREVILGKSYMRMNCASKFKMGGGVRVKKIELDDKWASMKNSTNSHVSSSTYGQEYDYTTIENGVSISSGVAQWEPSTGGEENPFKLPVWEIHKKDFGRDEKILHIEPFADAMYPSAGVGYSQVTVKSLGGKTGRTETLFYTAKDFPTRVEQTQLDKSTTDNPFVSVAKRALSEISKEVVNNSKMLSKFGLSFDYSFLKVQQGYCIINNDMHGKMKEQRIYPEGSNTPRSSVKYKYKTDPYHSDRLNNTVLTYDYQNDLVKEEDVALDFDVSYDKQAEQTITSSIQGQFNGDLFFGGVVPVTSFSFFPSFGFEMDNFQYAVVTKQINQYAILESTEAFEDGSTISTKNLLYDAFTGEILLTETQNEFNDKIYNLDYPAHFVYDGMGQAYRNVDVELTGITLSLGRIGTVNPDDGWKISSFLTWGDEVMLKRLTIPATYTRAWVHYNKDGDHCLINSSGNIISNDNHNTIKVIRSGRRNMQNIPVEKFTMLKNPLVYSSGSWHLDIDETNILNVSATTFSDDWQTFCDINQYKSCNSETDMGRAIKLWLYKMVKNKKMTQAIIYDDVDHADSIVPDTLKNYLICGPGTSKADNYVLDTNNETSLGHINYQFRIGSGPDCCPLDLSSDFTHCIKYTSHLYMAMFGPNRHTYKLSGTDYALSDLASFNEDSLSYRDSCIYEPVQEKDTCYPIIDTFTSYYLTKDIYDNISPTYTSGGITYNNYVYKTVYKADSFACNYLRFDDAIPGTVYPISLDTTKFQINTDSNNFKVLVTLNNDKKAWIYGTFECPIKLFKECCLDCMPAQTRVINPYLESVRGSWRKKADYAFHAKRTQTKVTSVVTPKLRSDGVFADFQHFWQYSSPAKSYSKNSSTSNWIKASEVNAYTPYGNEIEDVDALGMYSSALFAYKYKLPVAVAKNSKYTQMAYDGFEDYGMYGISPVGCAESHWTFEWNKGLSFLDTTIAHSGKYSLAIPADTNEMVSRKVIDCSSISTGVESDEYILNACNCIKKFSPDSGDYLISGWIREGHDSAQSLTTSYSHANITVKVKKTCLDTGIVYVFKADGPVIEEWQRAEGKFRIPKGYALIEVYLNAPSYAAWFDDLRIHPFLAEMKSYAYDKTSLRLMAELDENNFATFYEYDKEGQLMRVKKETVKGISTIKEVREHSSNRK